MARYPLLHLVMPAVSAEVASDGYSEPLESLLHGEQKYRRMV